MRKFLKIIGILLVVVVVLLTAGYVYLTTALPNVGPPPDLKVNATPQMIERGKYLAVGPAACIDCHSDRDFTKYSGPVVPGTEGKGGQDLGKDFGGDAGFVPARNITSDKETGIGNWTDGEIYRAITMGVDKHGDPLAPMMPYTAFGTQLDESDILAIIAYIRTLPPVKNVVPPKKLNFPLSLIVRTIPDKPKFIKLPPAANNIETGKYLSAACIICHTKMDKGQPDMAKQFAGGNSFPLPSGGYSITSNITPDMETGIGKWTKDEFIKKFKSYATPEGHNIPVKRDEANTVMPWTQFASMTESDLGALYDYLRTIPPINNKIEKFVLVQY
ncbi:MAG: cytochrome C [Ignavibacteriae bacterium]|nr:MAG: cytochrome C [Ignavibacteriota bacterium]